MQRLPILGRRPIRLFGMLFLLALLAVPALAGPPAFPVFPDSEMEDSLPIVVEDLAAVRLRCPASSAEVRDWFAKSLGKGGWQIKHQMMPTADRWTIVATHEAGYQGNASGWWDPRIEKTVVSLRMTGPGASSAIFGRAAAKKPDRLSPEEDFSSLAFPGSVRVRSLGAIFPNTASATLHSSVPSGKVHEWYSTRLEQDGWKMSVDRGEGANWVIAAKDGDGHRVQVHGRWDAELKCTETRLTLMGEGIVRQAFFAVPLEQEPEAPPPPDDDRGAGEERLDPLEVLKRKGIDLSKFPRPPGYDGPWPPQSGSAPQDGVPPGSGQTPPDEYQALMEELTGLLQELIDAATRWCDHPNHQNLLTALELAGRYEDLSVRFREMTSAYEESGEAGVGPHAAMFLHSILVDIDVGVLAIALWNAHDHPEDRDKLIPTIRSILEGRVKPQAVTFRENVKEVNDLVEASKEEMGPVLVEVTAELLQESEEPDFVPSTTLTVTRHWTPTGAFWAELLPLTWVAQRCWNMGCPEGCDHDRQICLAFGEGEKAWGAHCYVHGHLGSQGDLASEMKAYSEPLLNYGLTCFTIEVGDPKQLKAGGAIEVTVDGFPLMTVPLTVQEGPPISGINPFEPDAVRPCPEFGAFYEKLAKNVDWAYGKEAGRYYRTLTRHAWRVTEAGGGAFNGYVVFLPIGLGILPNTDGRKIDMVPLVPPTEPWVLRTNLMSIAKATHPALQRDHTIEIRAIVGEAASESAIIQIPGYFQDIPGHVGTFSGLPSTDSPSEWRFMDALGSDLPDADAPERIDIGAAQVKLMNDAIKLANAYQRLLMKKWVNKARDAAIGKILDKAVMDKLPKPGSWDEFATQSVGAKKWWGIEWNSLTDLSKWIDHHVADSVFEIGKGTYKEFLSTEIGASINIGLAGKWFDKYQRRRGLYDLSSDPTVRALTNKAQIKMMYHRRKICLIGEAHLEIGDQIGKWESYAGITKGVAESAFKESMKETFAIIDAAYGGATAGWAITDIWAMGEIEWHLGKIRELLSDPASWRSQGN